MARKDRLGIEKIIARVNKEFEKTSKQIDKLVGDATAQLDSLQNQVQEPIKKLLEDAEKIRERELKRIHEEFEKRVKEMSEFQQTILQKVGLAKAKPDPAPNTPKSDAPVKPTAAKKESPKKTPAAKPVKAAAKPSAKAPSGKKPAAGKASEPKAPAKKNASSPGLTKLAGVGPATAKQMKEAGILSLTQVANPSPADKELLAKFSSVKGSEGWEEQAKKLLG